MSENKGLGLRRIHVADVDAIVDLEVVCFAPHLQANRILVLNRMRLGHIMFGAFDQDALVGLICMVPTVADPAHPKALPKSLGEMCSQTAADHPNAAWIYNLEVHPKQRLGGRTARRLLAVAFDEASRLGLTYVFANARIPSYNGTTELGRKVDSDPVVRQAIDGFLDGSTPFPKEEVLARDPLLAFYYRSTNCKFLDIIPNAAPTDISSGGHRVIVFGLISDWLRRVTFNRVPEVLS